jgi:hypothetical protein
VRAIDRVNSLKTFGIHPTILSRSIASVYFHSEPEPQRAAGNVCCWQIHRDL